MNDGQQARRVSDDVGNWDVASMLGLLPTATTTPGSDGDINREGMMSVHVCGRRAVV
jgi:hypothetical protein